MKKEENILLGYIKDSSISSPGINAAGMAILAAASVKEFPAFALLMALLAVSNIWSLIKKGE